MHKLGFEFEEITREKIVVNEKKCHVWNNCKGKADKYHAYMKKEGYDMNRKKYRPKTTTGPLLVLEESEGVVTDLIVIKTRTNRKKMIKDIKINLEHWMKNHNFDEFRDCNIDLAIVAKVNKQRMKQQDIDNVAKVVLDALKKNENIDFKPEIFLFNDDSQIVRLLIYKMLRKEDKIYDTDSLTISFRKHDPYKQMILTEPKMI